MVRLLQFPCRWFSRISRSFNPTMVRSLLTKISHIFMRTERFQSHNGAIAATYFANLGTDLDPFQSHNGAIAANPLTINPLQHCYVSIPQWCDCCKHNLCRNIHQQRFFNPTMVRLLPQFCPVVCGNDKWFQSHNGAIAARCRTFEGNSAKVVSIPQWCDCCF